MQAVVISVNAKDTPGVKKVPRGEVTLVANHGVEGDYHAGTRVRHRSRAAKNPDEANVRQVHLIPAELFDELAAIGIAVTPGAMGENITTRGVGLQELAPGTRLRLGDAAVVEITGCRNPCAQLDGVDPRLLGEVAFKGADGTITRRAGVMGIVVEGGAVRDGDAITVTPPTDERAGTRLQPV